MDYCKHNILRSAYCIKCINPQLDMTPVKQSASATDTSFDYYILNKSKYICSSE